MASILSDKEIEDYSAIKSRVFEDSWQRALLGHMVKNAEFFNKCRLFIEPDLFINNRLNFIFKEYIGLFDKKIKQDSTDTKPPTGEEFKIYCLKKLDKEDLIQTERVWNDCIIQSDRIDLALIRKDITSWVRMAKFSKDAENVIGSFNKGNFNASLLSADKMVKEINQIDFDKDQSFDFSNMEEYLMNNSNKKKNGIFTGHKILDKLLAGEDDVVDRVYIDPWTASESTIKDVPGPGLKYEGSTVILAPTGGGKTTLMITMIRNTLLQPGKSVLYFTHEQSEGQVFEKIASSITELTVGELSKAYLNPEHMRRIEWAKNCLEVKLDSNGNSMGMRGIAHPFKFKWVHYTKAGGMYVEDVINMIRDMNDAKKAVDGRGYDLVVNDYPAMLQSKAFKGRNAEYRTELAYIYGQFVLLAKEVGFHAIMGAQTNREGFKKGEKGDDFIGLESVGESYGLAQVAENIITINTSQEDREKKLMHLYIAKSRSTARGKSFTSQVWMNRNIMFAEDYNFLEQNKLIPLEGTVGDGIFNERQMINHATQARLALGTKSEKEKILKTHEGKVLNKLNQLSLDINGNGIPNE